MKFIFRNKNDFKFIFRIVLFEKRGEAAIENFGFSPGGDDDGNERHIS